jgi:23S rRNA (guanosine2251-2'-O)-methyltransferase
MRKLKNSELNRLSNEDFITSNKTPITIVLDNVRSLHNVGSVFRTSDAFCLEAVYLCGITACPPHREIQKTALGATDTVKWEYAKTTLEAVEKLKASHQIVAVEQIDSSISLEEFEITEKPIALIFGNEVKGVDGAVLPLCDAAIEIPQFGTKHSLNISVSVGVVVWDLFSKINFKK